MIPFSRSAGTASLLAPIRRRSFLTYAGTAALALAGCQKKDATPDPTDVGSGDTGVLNLAYALKQVEAAFYKKVLAGGYFTALPPASAEHQLLSDIAQHEQLHVSFLRTVLATSARKELIFNLDDQVNFDVRATAPGTGKLGVLNAAQLFEDLGVATFNGAALFLITADYLTLLGKIVSVEARHAALIRDLLGTGFVSSDVVDATSRQEKSLPPAEAVRQLNAFLAPDSQLAATRLK